jgi:hypothetical protein
MIIVSLKTRALRRIDLPQPIEDQEIDVYVALEDGTYLYDALTPRLGPVCRL